MKRPDADTLYSDFISALFVALLFSWVQSSLPMFHYIAGQFLENSSVVRNGVQAAVAPSVGEDVSHPVDSSRSQDKIQSVPQGLFCRSILLFPALVCIWWWYQMHLARYAPARTFISYAIDFTTLLLFAVAIFHWSSSGRLFYFAIVLPTLAMIARFWHAYSRKRLPWISKSRRRLVYGGLALLFFTIVCLLIDVVCTKWYPETHNKILLECMAAGVVVTTISAAAIEGFTWVHPAPVIQRTDILVFLPPTNDDEYKNVPFASIAQFDRLAAIRFENDLTSDVPPAYRYIHMSNVHSLGDTRVHAFILSIPSINKPDEVIAKCYLTYAAHWLDDMFDRKINRRHLGKRIISTGGESWYDPVNQVDRKFRPIIKRVMTGITHHDYALVAIKRLMLGSLVFHHDSIAAKAVERHQELIQKYLLADTRCSQRDAVIEWFKTTNQAFVHLTAKTIQELWFACEEQKQPFGLTFLYSVLYGPALYYHDNAAEIKCGEMSEGASAAGLLPDATTVAHVIENVGQLIEAYKDDPLRKARKIQISTVAKSFQIVLEKQVRDSYERVASML